MRTLALALALAAFGAWTGCVPEPSAETTAIAFLETFVYSVDKSAALNLAAGAAAEKIRGSAAESSPFMELFAHASSPGRPPIARTLLRSESIGNGRTAFTFRLERRPKGGLPVVEDVTLRVERVSGRWKVVDFGADGPDGSP